ncbi:alpha/beta hydrolase fold-domain containing protein [Alteromonas naphthalenivorans]|uniref:Alpha/beta hydrolase fold-domain containing protein n=2 Tax=Alteromonas naphthalenivorans TaxID=715451 RepID=F5ZCR8_ALTNA|nr:alpha/beta hydrolase fold-domain containing protein [Alteromonas naphthalenivorans]
MRVFFKFFSFGLILLLLVGFVYQSYKSYVDSSSFEKSGEMLDVGGYSLYVEDSGSGKVNVIFDSGMGDDLSVWNKVANKVSKFSRVITYDRAGLGWSEESPKKRDSKAIIEELHSILEQKNLTGPIVLVGHSFGGVNMQLYALTYPEDIAALVLVDSAHEDQINRMPRTGLFQKYVLKFGMLAAPFGLPRLYLSNTSPEERAKKSTTKHQYTSLDEASYFPQSLNQLDTLNPNYGGLPLVVIARNQPSSEIQNKNTKHYIWAGLQESLASRSTDSTLIFTGERQHSIHKVQPEIVIEAIQTLVNGF